MRLRHATNCARHRAPGRAETSVPRIGHQAARHVPANVVVRAMGRTPPPKFSGIWILAATLLGFGLAGCAAVGPKPGSPVSEASLYVGVFTGEFVDGKPLYRFPAIHVVGTRSGAGLED